MSGVGVILRMLREPPAVRGPLFRKLAIAHVIMAAVLIPFWEGLRGSVWVRWRPKSAFDA